MEFDATFFALVALVLFFGVVFYAGAHRKVGVALDDRTALISKEIADARKLREEAEYLLAQYKQKRLDAEKEAADIISNARSEASAYVEESKRKLADLLERRVKQAELKISQAEAAAEKEVRGAAADLAISLASRTLGAKAKGRGGEDLIADSIAAVKARLN